MDVKGRVIYLAGPMTGKPHLNRAVFAEATGVLREMGAVVYNPAGTLMSELVEKGHKEASAAWRENVRFMANHCDAMVMLPGWEDSPGAALENELARTMGLTVMEYSEVGE